MKQVQINISYILTLVQKYHDSNCADKEIIANIRKLVDASPDMRDKRDLIEMFVERVSRPDGTADVGQDWQQFIVEEKRRQLDAIIDEERLKRTETYEFMDRAFADGYVTETGTGIVGIMPPTNPFLPESNEKKRGIIARLKEYLHRFEGTGAEGISLAPCAAKMIPYTTEEETQPLAAEEPEEW